MNANEIFYKHQKVINWMLTAGGIGLITAVFTLFGMYITNQNLSATVTRVVDNDIPKIHTELENLRAADKDLAHADEKRDMKFDALKETVDTSVAVLRRQTKLLHKITRKLNIQE